MNQNKTDVVIIGAGPSGAVAACLLLQQGHNVIILEKTKFPRFVIGESLLPQCLQILEKADCLEAVEKANFQIKTGASFQHKGKYKNIIFKDKFTSGPSTAFHVLRGEFDHILANCAEEQGAQIRYLSTVTSVRPKFGKSQVTYEDVDKTTHTIEAKFILDASGYGRVLPRLLKIDKPSSLEPKASFFTHVNDNIDALNHNRKVTLITTHPQHRDVWYWLISFSNGRSSVGVVGHPDYIQPYQEHGINGLKQLINEDKELSKILAKAQWDTQDYKINAYSGNVSQFYGDGFAVLGNAGEFLDPVFSSGVTVAMQSADLAVSVLDSQLKGLSYDWQHDYVEALKIGIETFKCFVNNWYTGGFQDVIYSSSNVKSIQSMVASILAGYAWDKRNPFVEKPQQRLESLIKICQQ